MHKATMANQEKASRSTINSSQNGSSSEGEEGKEQWLVNTREKRSTAGNRLHILLQQEDIDDDLELLFAEEEEDAGFSDVVDEQSDELMDSSSDNEDQGPAAVDDFEGEKELQRATRIEQARQKKKQRQIPVIPKRTHDSYQESPSAPPKKKSERISWLPSPSDAPIRASSRGTTRQSKQELQLQMMDREIKRLKQVANMEKAAAAKAAKEKPPLTQEDRLKEAARVEKANAKSLSRWERAEEERELEQKQRLANLHNRYMEGPVLTYWSGMATYVGGKLQKLGKIDMEIKQKPATKKRKVEEVDALSIHDHKKNEADTVSGPLTSDNTNLKSAAPGSEKIASTNSEFNPIPQAAIEQSAAPSRVLPAQPPQKPASSCLAPPAGLPLLAPPHQFLAPPRFDSCSPLPLYGYYKSHAQQHHQYLLPLHQPHVPLHAFSALPALPAPLTAPPAVEYCLRSSIIFNNFNDAAIKSRETQLNVLLPFAITCPARLSKPSRTRNSNKSILCAITGYPARYRDPKTGLPYCNSYAYQEIQKLSRGEILWSDLAGVYVGKATTVAAMGVPERFKGIVEKKTN